MGFVYLFIYFVEVDHAVTLTAYSVISVTSVVSEFSTWPFKREFS